jgi:hypothetical protein
VLVIGSEIEKLLAVPKLASGTGEQMVQATVTALTDWHIPLDPTVASCFDTTSSNIGVHARACSILQRFMGKSLLHTACWYCIHEVVCLIFTDMLWSIIQSRVKMFQRFHDYLSKINPKEFQVMRMDDKVYGNLPAAATAFAQKALQGT